MAGCKKTIDAIENWLRIDREGPPEALARARGVYVVILTLIGLQIINFAGLVWSYGLWHADVLVCVLFTSAIGLSVVLLRWVKRFSLYAIFYTCLTLGAVAASALPEGKGINSSLLPVIAIGPMVVGYIFDWRAAVAYGVIGALFVAMLWGVSLGNDNFGQASETLWLFQRFIQTELALTIGTIVAVNFSLNTFKSLEKLQGTVARATEAEEAKSQFLATMSHELRTPLNGIIGMAEALCASNVTAKERDMVETIRRSGESLLVIIGDLLDLSKIEAGKCEIEPRPFSLKDLVRHTADSWTEAAAMKGLSIRTKIYSGLPDHVLGDDHRIGQILQNLVSNAIKFTEKGGVVIELAGDLEAEPPCFSFRVMDSGTGVPDGLREQVFEPFRQGEGGTTRRYGGTGLGLPICRLLAELMGGSIEIEETSEDGSIFRLDLPLPIAEESVAETKPNALAAAPALDGVRVLVAEDNEINRMVLREFLSAWGVAFVFAHDGPETLEALKVDRFDLILLDKHMPGMGGLDVAVKIRRTDAPYRNIPIIAVSADSMPDEIEDTLAAGMDDFVAKPIRPDVLRRAMEEVLRREDAIKAEIG